MPSLRREMLGKTTLMVLFFLVLQFSAGTEYSEIGGDLISVKNDFHQVIPPNNFYYYITDNTEVFSIEPSNDSTLRDSSGNTKEKCVGPQGCELCYNASTRIFLSDFKYFPNSNDYRQQVMLLHPRKYANKGTEDIVKLATYSKSMNHSFSWLFNERLDFATYTILNSSYPTRPLHSPNEDIYIGMMSGPQSGQLLTYVEPATYEDVFEVCIPPKEFRRVSAHSSWISPDVPTSFDATVEFIPTTLARCVPCSQGSSICYEVTPSSADLQEILSINGFKGEILSKYPLKAKISGVFQGSYGENADYVIS